MPAAPVLLDPVAAASPAAEAFDAVAFQAATGATPAQMADLEAFRAALADWNARMNLVGPTALAEFWLRHAYDSAQLLQLETEALRWADLGAGAGFPGLVLAILLKGRPGAMVHLIESMTKRCRFLEEIVTALALPAVVHNARAEDLDISVDVVAARACAPLVRLFGYAQPYLRRGAVGLFMKGQDVVAELEAAATSWRFEAELVDSRSHREGRIVRMRKLKHV
jgi:16S rRNA (guanine527-N7)-methyltransferase